MFQKPLPRIDIFLIQDFKYRVIHSVKMALCARTVLRIALRLIADAELFLCRDCDYLILQSARFQDLKRLLGDSSRNRLGRQIEDLLRKPLPDGAHGREYRAHRLSDSRGRLDKELLFAQDRPVDSLHQLPLPVPVGEWKFESLHGTVAELSPVVLELRPFVVFVHESGKPQIQLILSIRFPEILLFLRIQVAVCHLHRYGLQMVLQAVNVRITLCLRQMHRNGSRKLLQIHIDPLDLINGHPFRLCPDPVSAALNAKGELVIFFFIYQRHLGAVAHGHGFLDFPMDAAAFLHRLLIRESISPVIQIAASQQKFHKRADRETYLRQLGHGDASFFII